MDEPPAAVFSTKDARGPEIHWRDILSSAHLGLEPLYFDDVRQVRRDVLRYCVEAAGLPFPVVRCGTLHRFSDLRQSAREGAEGVAESYAFPFGEQLLGRLVVPFHELTACQAVRLDYLVQILSPLPGAHRLD